MARGFAQIWLVLSVLGIACSFLIKDFSSFNIPSINTISSMKSSNRRFASRLFVDGKGYLYTKPIDTDVIDGIEPTKPKQPAVKLGSGITSTNFLSNILEYGKNRMARRAVGVLQKMPAYRVYPTTEHYDAALWACQNSDQFQLAMSVYMEMKENDILFSVKSYEALVAVAERKGRLEDALGLFKEMRGLGIKGNTDVFNSCLWACVNNGNFEKAFELLDLMQKDDIPTDSTSYAACMMACESAGNGTMALKVFELMRKGKVPLNTPIANAIMWACVKSGMYDEALLFFDTTEDTKIKKDAMSYTAAIWSCEGKTDSKRAVELLRLMKFDGLDRTVDAFNGVLSTLKKTKEWEQLCEILIWMDRDEIKRNLLTYTISIETLDAADQEALAMDLYVRALRENLISPWLKGTRIVNLQDLTYPVAKTVMRNVLTMIRDKKLPPFNLIVNVKNISSESCRESCRDMATKIEEYLQSVEPKNILLVEEFEEDHIFKLRIKRELLVQWLEKEPIMARIIPSGPSHTMNDSQSYTSAIWACNSNADSKRAMELLLRMKSEGLERSTDAFNGMLSILKKTGEYEIVSQILQSMDDDHVTKNFVTFCTAIEAYEMAGKDDLAMSVYIQALREKQLSPWLEGTRVLDLRGLSFPMAKTVLRNILFLIQEKKLPAFDLVMKLYDLTPDVDATYHETMYQTMTRPLEEAVRLLQPINILEMQEGIEGTIFKLRISRDKLLEWTGGYSY